MGERLPDRSLPGHRPRRVSRSAGELWRWPAGRGTVIEAHAPAAAPGQGLRIGLLAESLLPRGAVVHSLALAEALTAAGHRVTLFAPAAPGERLFRTPACTVAPVPVPATPPGAAGAWAQARIAGLVAHLRAHLAAGPAWDVLHAQDDIGANALAELQAQGRIGPWLRTVHHLAAPGEPALDALRERGLRQAGTLLCLSPLGAQRLRQDRGLHAEPVPQGVDLARFQPAPGALDALLDRRFGLHGRPLVLAIGGIGPRQNADRLLDAFVQWRRQRPQAQLLLAGGPPLGEADPALLAFRARLAALDGDAAEAGVPRWGQPGSPVVLSGPLPDDLMPALYRRASLLAQIGLNEGPGLSVLEALACGCPVLLPQGLSVVPGGGEGPEPAEEPLLHTALSRCDPEQLPAIVAGLERAAAQPHFDPPALCRQASWTRSAQRHLAVYRAHRARHGADGPPGGDD